MQAEIAAISSRRLLSEAAMLLQFSFDELNSLLCALQTHLRDDEGTLTAEGRQHYQALHDRLELAWQLAESGGSVAVNQVPQWPQ